MSEVALVAALDRNRAIGRGGTMPWHLPADLAHFKGLTLGKPILMGRRTALAIGRILPGRENLVLSRGDTAPYSGQVLVRSLDEAISVAGGQDLMVIGGGEVYALALPHATRLHLTWIDVAVADADTWFPVFDPDQWVETARRERPADARNAHAMSFADYRRAAGG